MVNSILVATLYVNPVTGNDKNAGTRLLPYKTLTRALKLSRTAIIIQLAPGTYSSANGELFPLIVPGGVMVVGNEATKGQGIIISGSGEYQSESFGTQNITLRLLDNSSLMGVTVTNSIAKGTGVWIESNASPTLANNTLVGCGREGVFVSGNAKPAILDNVFVENGASGLFMARHSKGEVLRNVWQRNAIAIAISDFAAPLLANNQISQNQTAIALAREARPVLLHNIIEKNPQGGLLVNGNAIPDLGSAHNPAGNIFRDNEAFDIQNATSNKLVSVGNQLNPVGIKGLVELSATAVEAPKSVTVSTSFSDLRGHWAAAFVEALLSKGLISGLGDGKFQAQASMNRAAFAAIIAKAFDVPAKKQVSKFTDVKPDFWAAASIQRAASMGFLGGFPDGTFRPGQNLTKVQAIVSIVNGLQINGGNPHVLAVYRDRAQIPSYAIDAIAIATQKLLVLNYPQTELLEPLRDITRAEVAALIYQALVANGKQKPIVSPYIVNPDADIPSFTDIMGHWAEGFIRALVSMNITRGFADGTYKPDKSMTRAQYTALVVAAFNPTPKRPVPDFTDVPPEFWAYKAIQQAAQGGFVGGFGDGSFHPQQNVQRLQVIVSLVNGLTLPPAHADTLLNFNDRNKIPEYARTAVATATVQRIIVNYPDPKQIEPLREATRAEVAAMVYQALVAIGRSPSVHSPYIVSPFSVTSK
ncbi:S-layer homology domain-containing protein [Chlorogloeopsis sp. ULAP01]|uniref:S-layer homology domain-containing protein n=1 Tax=Chlorogloeopsis sp. ULAP01 TaxID=3056483 RepID=UPI0025AA50A5|nr:S-layer homology domain-containing protein [Chlorogloeopsis sp. ULAP01]MDM9381366.1 S-layer homology domain-containing protein [Chlorogloeopsis sp. ULAP01]